MEDYDIRYHHRLDKIYRQAVVELAAWFGLFGVIGVLLWCALGPAAGLPVIGMVLVCTPAFLAYERAQHRRYKQLS